VTLVHTLFRLVLPWFVIPFKRNMQDHLPVSFPIPSPYTAPALFVCPRALPPFPKGRGARAPRA